MLFSKTKICSGKSCFIKLYVRILKKTRKKAKLIFFILIELIDRTKLTKLDASLLHNLINLFTLQEMRS